MDECHLIPAGNAGLNRQAKTRNHNWVGDIQSVHQNEPPVAGEGMYRQFLADAKVLNPHVRVVGFTATPFRLDAGQICREDYFLVHPEFAYSEGRSSGPVIPSLGLKQTGPPLVALTVGAVQQG